MQYTYAIVALVFTFLCLLFRTLFSPLRNVPGPFITRFTKAWYFGQIWSGDFHQINIKLHQKYGKVVRTSPNEYSIDDPDAVKIIYGLGSQFPKAGWYWGFANPHQKFETLFTTRSIPYHNATRRAVQTHYQMSTLVGYEDFVNDCGRLLIQRLDEFSINGVIVNLGDWLQKYAFDVIGAISFGRRFGFLDRGEDIGGLIKALEKRRVFTSLSGVYPLWHGMAFRLMSCFPGSGAAGFTYLSRFGQEQLAQRKAEARANPEACDGPVPQVDRFLNAHSEKPESFPMHAVLTNLMGNVFAGSDTTGISLTAIVNNLCRNPESVQKLRTEIENHVSNQQPPEPISFREAQSMPYLNAVIKESLRLHPATGLPLFRKVPPGGTTISGQFFPEGTTVGINSWVAHHNQSVFGSDVHVFRPERWFEADSKRLSLMEQYDFPFGLGSRNCLGKNISLLEISKVIPQLVRHFDFELETPNLELHCENRWFVKQTNFRCKVIRREAS